MVTNSKSTDATNEYLEETEEEGVSKSGKKLGVYIYVLPNLFTTANIFCGFYSVVFSLEQNFKAAAIAIIAAAVMDLMDGRVARMTRATSKFGAEYDSLSDLVSFGMAPSLLMFNWALGQFGRLGIMVSFLFVACGALRLARFNVQEGVIEKNFFQGLPIPMAAGIIASAFLAFEDMGWEPAGWMARLLLFLVGLLAVVMVSTFRYRSFKDLDFRKRLPFKYLFLGVLIITLVSMKPELMLFVLFVTYAALGAVFGIFRLGVKAKRRISKTSEDKYIEVMGESDDEIQEENH